MRTPIFRGAKAIRTGIVLVALLSGCGATRAPLTPATPATIENRFFTLDLEREVDDMGTVRSHFFTTFPHDDPTEGDVVYDRKQWVNEDMITLEDGEGLFLHIRDRKDNRAYDSVRLTSRAYYNLGEATPRILFVFKGAMPSGRGIWPAWWLNGGWEDTWTYRNAETVPGDADLDAYSGKGHFYDTPSAVNVTDWPGGGEIDIIETINGDNVIHNTIHTCPQMCDAEWNGDGVIENCANARPGDPNPGCSGRSYQTDAPEGTFACLWEDRSLRFYYWEPGSDVRSAGGPLSARPAPEQWESDHLVNAVRLLETDAECSDAEHQAWQCQSCEERRSCVFRNMKVIFNITLCGKWAGAQFDGSAQSTENCRDWLFGDGRANIDGQYIRIEYLSVTALP